MQRTMIKDILSKNGAVAKVCGFVENIRDGKSMAFIVIKDITGKLQITVEKEKCPDLIDEVAKITPDSVISCTGTVAVNEYVKLGGVELLPTEIIVESVAEALPIVRKEIPATKKKQAVERSFIDQRLNYRWVDLRTDENQLLFKVQSCLVNAMRQYLTDNGFIEIHSPKLIGAASESGADVFEVKYFDRKAYLAQSPQFYKQMAMASGFERIFEVGPVFRAEKSFTSKHTTEFTGFDLEMSYIESYRDVMDMEAGMLAYALGVVKEKYGESIKEAFGTEVIVPALPFPVVSLDELYDELEKEYGYKPEGGDRNDLMTDAERLSFDWVMKKYGHEFLFVVDYPTVKRAFYHMREDGKALGYDLIWRGVEITTGAQREHRYEQLKAQADEKGLAEDVKFYLEFFKYGCPPHGGFGLGVDRLTMLLLGLTIKEAMFLFRSPDRLNP
ncbi:MAG: aspartate--tRNA(Asn) ligase [Clostridia bacterium]|nr:aspartate--tRNA(Asn) ligase [Clostridia bacterium]